MYGVRKMPKMLYWMQTFVKVLLSIFSHWWSRRCFNISSGCRAYRDVAPGGWLEEVRRWPPNLVTLQRNFLAKTPVGVDAP